MSNNPSIFRPYETPVMRLVLEDKNMNRSELIREDYFNSVAGEARNGALLGTGGCVEMALDANFDFIPGITLPEPSTYAPMAVGLLAMGAVARRRRCRDPLAVCVTDAEIPQRPCSQSDFLGIFGRPLSGWGPPDFLMRIATE
jgi:hypothetical protein